MAADGNIWKTVKKIGLGKSRASVADFAFDIEIELKDNSREYLEALGTAIESGLKACGLLAERHAKEIITAANAVDTGRLRNSITFALAGQSAAIDAYDWGVGVKTGAPEGAAVYSGTAPKNANGERAVYVGSNVEYAHGIETGSGRRAGGVHFLQGAVNNYGDEYKRLMKEALDSVKLE